MSSLILDPSTVKGALTIGVTVGIIFGDTRQSRNGLRVNLTGDTSDPDAKRLETEVIKLVESDKMNVFTKVDFSPECVEEKARGVEITNKKGQSMISLPEELFLVMLMMIEIIKKHEQAKNGMSAPKFLLIGVSHVEAAAREKSDSSSQTDNSTVDDGGGLTVDYGQKEQFRIAASWKEAAICTHIVVPSLHIFNFGGSAKNHTKILDNLINSLSKFSPQRVPNDLELIFNFTECKDEVYKMFEKDMIKTFWAKFPEPDKARDCQVLRAAEEYAKTVMQMMLIENEDQSTKFVVKGSFASCCRCVKIIDMKEVNFESKLTQILQNMVPDQRTIGVQPFLKDAQEFRFFLQWSDGRWVEKVTVFTQIDHTNLKTEHQQVRWPEDEQNRDDKPIFNMQLAQISRDKMRSMLGKECHRGFWSQMGGMTPILRMDFLANAQDGAFFSEFSVPLDASSFYECHGQNVVGPVAKWIANEIMRGIFTQPKEPEPIAMEED